MFEKFNKTSKNDQEIIRRLDDVLAHLCDLERKTQVMSDNQHNMKAMLGKAIKAINDDGVKIIASKDRDTKDHIDTTEVEGKPRDRTELILKKLMPRTKTNEHKNT